MFSSSERGHLPVPMVLGIARVLLGLSLQVGMLKVVGEIPLPEGKNLLPFNQCVGFRGYSPGTWTDLGAPWKRGNAENPIKNRAA